MTNAATNRQPLLWGKTMLACAFGGKWEIVDLEWVNRFGDTLSESAYACRPDLPGPIEMLIDRDSEGWTLVSADVIV